MQHTRPFSVRRVMVKVIRGIVHRRVASAFGFAAIAAAQLNAQAPRAATPATQKTVAASAYVPHRVYDSKKKQWIDFETLLQRANAMDLVFVGELHDNTPGHVMELAILEGLARRRAASNGTVVVSLEMFERDTQGELDRYLNGEIDEATFLARSRPWPNYNADYRPLVEIARAHKWPVIASNIPRPLASMVNRGGLPALDTINATIRANHVASNISCPRDQYYKNFAGLMGDMSGHGAATANATISKDSAKVLADKAQASLFRMYEAQCVKDETMGESIARAFDTAKAAGPGATVVHMNGSFHTDYALGTAERAMTRAGKAKGMVITIIPAPDLDNVDAKSMRKRADYLIFTVGKAQ